MTSPPLDDLHRRTPLTNAEKRRIVDQVIALECQRVAEGHDRRSNRELARICGVSSQMLNAVREPQPQPCVYFVGAEDGFVKIGWTSRPVEHRLSDLQTGSPIVIRVLGCIEGPRSMEAFAHQVGALGRKHGEWFDRDCAFHVYTVLSRSMKVRIGWTP